MALRRKTAYVSTMVVLALCAIVGAYYLYGQSNAEGQAYGERELAAGVYRYQAPEMDEPLAEVVYVANDDWLRRLDDNEEFGRLWTARIGDRLFSASFETGEILVTRDFPSDLVPERFILDRLFLDRHARGDLEGFGREVEASGVASRSEDGLVVPELLGVGAERFEVADFRPSIEVTPRDALERLLEDDRFYLQEESEIAEPEEVESVD